MDRRTLLLGTLGIGPLGIGPLGLGSLGNVGPLAGPASAQDATGKPDTAKGLKIVPRSGPLAGEPLYTNSHAVLIGISKYQHLSSDKQLKYARKDAEDVRALLAKSFGFPESNITLLVDEGATKRSIETAIGRLNRTLATDRVLIFFSGHGMSVRGSDGDIGMLVPHDANVNLSGTTADGVTDCILMNSVWELLDLAPAKHRLLIADACFSGLLAKPRALEPFSPEGLKQLATQKALQAITASGKTEISKESDGFRNGIFTRKFLDFLEEMAGAPGQVLTAREVADRVLRRVSSATDGTQTPQYGDKGTEGQFLFVNVDPSAAPVLAPGEGKVAKRNLRASLRLTGLPTGAVVKVDGKALAGDRYEVDLIDVDRKEVTVFVTAEGYESEVSEAVLERGKDVAKAISLTRIPRAKVVFTNLPDGAVITVDGKVLKGVELDVDLTMVETKTVSVVVTAPGYKADGADITLVRGENVEYRYERARDTAATIENAPEKPSPTTPRVFAKGRLTDYPQLRAYVESLCNIPAGTFQMGSTSGDSDEKPKHTVRLPAFRMGATPVTVAMWKEYCVATGSSMPEAPTWGWVDDHPMVSVSWNDIMGVDGKGGYCAWSSEIAGFKLTLPTEAQWEYAARGGKEGLSYPWGNNFDRSKLWCSSRAFGDAVCTAPVTRSSNIFRNGYGLTDMVGNVWQWCSDRYGSYSSFEQTDPTGPSSGEYRCVRGGSWKNYIPVIFRCAIRNRYHPDYRDFNFGFRLSTGPA